MDFAELIGEALTTLTVNKLRSGLAILGIVIGIGSVITLLSLGAAGQKAVEEQIQSLGSNLLTVIPGALRPGDFRSTSGTSTTLILQDAKAISQSPNIGSVKVSAELLRRSSVTYGRNRVSTQVIGVLPSYQEIRNLELADGNFISKIHLDSLAKVAVLGPQVSSNLFGEGVNPVGKTIRIDRLTFRVIGVTLPKGGSGFTNLDDMILIPLSTAQKQLFGVDYVGSISIKVENKDKMDEVRDKIGFLLLSRHKISDPLNADFTIFSQADVLGAAQQVTGIFTGVLSGIAAISLLVGGIGIMNIMLVTVIERTREIGLRKALGAKKQTIVYQFLIESIVLTVLGGVLGMILGVILSFVIASLINLPFVISFSAIILAISVSCAIGIIFGWYPARKAANLSPIEALRYE